MRPITFSTLSLLALTFCLSFPFLSPAKEAVQLSAPSADRQDAVLHFYLVRHGQTWSNSKEMTIGGGGNAQLTPKGRYDANSLGLGLAEIDFIGGYSSTLGRAYETANRVLRGRDLSVVKIEDRRISRGERLKAAVSGISPVNSATRATIFPSILVASTSLNSFPRSKLKTCRHFPSALNRPCGGLLSAIRGRAAICWLPLTLPWLFICKNIVLTSRFPGYLTPAYRYWS